MFLLYRHSKSVDLKPACRFLRRSGFSFRQPNPSATFERGTSSPQEKLHSQVTALDLIDRLAEHKTLGTAPRRGTGVAGSSRDAAHLGAGEVLSHKGAQVEGFYVVLSGHVSLSVDRGSGPQKMIEWRAGDVSGILPYSRLTTPPGDAIAQEPTEILALPSG